VPTVSVEVKKQVKLANDIVDVISTYIPVITAGKTYKAVCPFHNDTRPSLQVDRTYQNYRCWACDARGDVFDFVMKFDKVEFPEALQMLAERAGIQLQGETLSPQEQTRGRLLRACRWAEEQYQSCLLEMPLGEGARKYLGERRLSGATVRQFGLGFAPLSGDWLVSRALDEGYPFADLVEVGLIAPRDEQRGFYDRFRDRVMFPIRDVRGQTVGFGGRILPSSPYAARGPKYYNSAETPLFSKSDLLYGLDLARHPGAQVGSLAVVEGYTDVMMAHQCGVDNVVATMGTALNARHVTQLRRYAPKVVLVFDADEGGIGGVDRALELFVSQDAELAVATLPEGQDPCDLLQSPGGVEQFRKVLATGQDALEYKLNAMLQRESTSSIEGTRRIIDSVLGIIALAPSMGSQNGQVRQELIISRLAHRLGVRQETIYARLGELRTERKRKEANSPQPSSRSFSTTATVPAVNKGIQSDTQRGPAMAVEKQLIELLLAEPELVPEAMKSIELDQITHSGIRRLVTELYSLEQSGQYPDFDGLRIRLLDRPDLVQAAMQMQDIGRHMKERPEWLQRIIRSFADQRDEAEKKALKAQLSSADVDEDQAVELLRRIQNRRVAPASEN
jgi:DNA primase